MIDNIKHTSSPPAELVTPSSQCFYSVNVETDKDIEYSNMATWAGPSRNISHNMLLPWTSDNTTSSVKS